MQSVFSRSGGMFLTFISQDNRIRYLLPCLIFFLVLVWGQIPASAAGIEAMSRLSITEADGSSYAVTLTQVDAVAPWEIDTLRIEAPDGSEDSWCCFNNWRQWYVDYNYQDGTVYSLPDENIQNLAGTYTATLTDKSGMVFLEQTDSSSFNELPVVDMAMSSPATGSYISTLTPILSWDPVVDETITPYYQVEIFQYDYDKSPSYISPITSATTISVPADNPETGHPVLEDVHRYRWRVRVFDGATRQEISNVSISDYATFYVERVNNPPAFDYCQAQSLVKEGAPQKTRFIGGLINTLPEEITILLKGPDGQVIPGFTMGQVEYPGWFSWSPATNDSPGGTYTFEVHDLDTNNLLDTCTTDYQPNWDLSPVEDVFTPEDQSLLYTETPTFSWLPVDEATQYRIFIMDYGWKSYVYWSPLTSGTTIQIPEGYLKKNSAYQVRISAYDGTGDERGNRADGEWKSFFITYDAAPAHISGTISAGSSGYVDGDTIIVAAFRSHSLDGSDFLGWTSINSLGQYSLYNMPMNTDIYIYALADEDGDGEPSAHEWQGWHSSSAVQLTTPGTTAGMDIVLNEEILEASISGTINIDHFEPGHGPIYIGVFSGPDTHGDPLQTSQISEPGPYTVSGLAAGVEYSVGMFWDVDDSGDPTPGDADGDYPNNPIITVAGDNPDIDVALEVGGVISGTITDGTNPIADVHVYFIDSSNNNYMGGINTDINGNYSYGLPLGTYQVNACPQCPYPPLPFVNQTKENISLTPLQNVPVNFQLETGGYITGTVTFNNTGVGNILVSFRDSTTFNYMGQTFTDTDGNYTSPMLPPGTYDVTFEPPCNTGLIVLTVDNAATVEPGNTETVEVTLEQGGTIQGTITDDASNPNPLDNIHVYFTDSDITNGDNWVGGTNTSPSGQYCYVLPFDHSYDVNACPGCNGTPYVDETKSAGLLTAVVSPLTRNFQLESVGYIAGTATFNTSGVDSVHVSFYDSTTHNGFGDTFTNADGSYISPMLPPGTYDVTFEPPCDTGLTVLTVDNAATVEPGNTETVEVTLEQGGTIQGTITDDATNPNPLDNIYVYFTDSDITNGDNWVGGTNTSPNGQYCYVLPFDHSYDVNACLGCDGHPYVNETQSAGLLTAAVSPVIRDFQLETGGYIAGTATFNTSGIGSVHVSFYDSTTYNGFGDTFTNTDGTYTSPMLPPGTYDVIFEPPCDTGFIVLTVDNAATVEPGNTETVEVTLEQGGTIQGTIIDADNNPLDNIQVNFSDSNITNGDNWVGGTNTSPNGQYCYVLPFDHSYDVNVCPGCDGHSYVNETQSTGQLTAATSPVIRDFTLQPAAVICGTVRDPSDAPIAGIEVEFLDPDTMEGFGQVFTDNTGHYCSLMLVAGTYDVYVYPNRSGFEYVDEKYPTSIALSTGETKTGIDFKLNNGGTICGRVIEEETGVGIDNLWVSFQNSTNNEWAGGINTDSSGNYCYTLPIGTYYVYICPSCSGLEYVDEQYPTTVHLSDFSKVYIDQITLESINSHRQRTGFLPAVYQLLLLQ